eukprot:6204294-Pleurochrysis_carterae.AAC.1
MSPPYHIPDAVIRGMDLSLDAFWERGINFPPFKVDNNSAVEGLRAVLDSATVGKRVSHSFCLTEAVAVQVGHLFWIAKDAHAKDAFAPHIGLQSVYALLASIQRVSVRGTYALKRLANSELFDKERRGQDASVLAHEGDPTRKHHSRWSTTRPEGGSRGTPQSPPARAKRVVI